MTCFRLTGAFLWTALFLAMAGCSVGPKYHPPVAPVPSVYKESPAQFQESNAWNVAQPSDSTAVASNNKQFTLACARDAER